MNENDKTPSSSDEEIDVCLPGTKNKHALFEIHVSHPPNDKKPSTTTEPFSAPRGGHLLKVAPFDDERCHSDSDTSDDEIQRSNYCSNIQTRSSNGGRTMRTNLHDNESNDEEQEVDSFEPTSLGFPPQMPPWNTNLLSDSFTPHQSDLLADGPAYGQFNRSGRYAESDEGSTTGVMNENDNTPPSSDEEIDVWLPGTTNEHALFEIHTSHAPNDTSSITDPFPSPRERTHLRVISLDDEHYHSDESAESEAVRSCVSTPIGSASEYDNIPPAIG